MHLDETGCDVMHRTLQGNCEVSSPIRDKKIAPERGYWRSRRDSNPRCRFCPHTPLAGEHLRPLGHDSGTGVDSSWSLLGRVEFQVERLVQRTHGELHVLLVDHDAGLDLTRGDHLDVDA